MNRSGGHLGSSISLASHSSQYSSQSGGRPGGHRSKPARPVREIHTSAYQNTLSQTQSYREMAERLAQGVNTQVLAFSSQPEALLTRIRSSEIDAAGADKILWNLQRTTEALDDLQKDVDFWVQSHNQLVAKVSLDPRFDRRA